MGDQQGAQGCCFGELDFGQVQMPQECGRCNTACRGERGVVKQEMKAAGGRVELLQEGWAQCHLLQHMDVKANPELPLP